MEAGGLAAAAEAQRASSVSGRNAPHHSAVWLWHLQIHSTVSMKPFTPLTATWLAAGVLTTMTAVPQLVQAQASMTAAAPDPQPQLTLPRVTVHAGFHRLDVQVARQPREREIGLMYRQHMPDHEGMLFVFEVPAVQCFWMKNTLIPLTAAFIANDGRIVNLADMAPQTTESHCSEEPVRYVLETNRGWFDTRHITAGQRLRQDRFFDAP